jgi:deoxyribose-phosphate aldolase
MQLKLAEFKKRLEYSLCKQFSGAADVRDFCDGAIKAGVGVICVNPFNVSIAAECFRGTNRELSSNVGFL